MVRSLEGLIRKSKIALEEALVFRFCNFSISAVAGETSKLPQKQFLQCDQMAEHRSKS